MDTALPDISFEYAIRFGRIEQAEEVYSVFGDSLEALEGENASILCRPHQSRRILHSVVIGHGDDFNSLFLATSNHGGIVVRFVCKRGRLVMPKEIGEWVDLQRASIEARTIW